MIYRNHTSDYELFVHLQEEVDRLEWPCYITQRKCSGTGKSHHCPLQAHELDILQTFDRKAECADMEVSVYIAAKKFVESCVIQYN